MKPDDPFSDKEKNYEENGKKSADTHCSEKCKYRKDRMRNLHTRSLLSVMVARTE